MEGENGMGAESEEHRSGGSETWDPVSKTSSPLGFPTSPQPLGEQGNNRGGTFTPGPGNYSLPHTVVPAGRRSSLGCREQSDLMTRHPRCLPPPTGLPHP